MDLSIVIVTYNLMEMTRKCLQSIIQHTSDLSYEIICVDNNSSDGTVEMIKKEFPTVKLIQNNANLGFAKAQNIGILQTQGDYILILNNDIFFTNNVCKILIDFLRQDTTNRVAIGPKIVNADGSLAPSSGHVNQAKSKMMIFCRAFNRHFPIKPYLPNRFLREKLGFLLGKAHYHYLPTQKIEQVEFIDGMFLLVDRKILKETGLFDERYFFDYEITDLCHRIKKTGKEIWYYPEVSAIHLGAASRKTYSPILVETQRSELIYYFSYQPSLLSFVKYVNLLMVNLKIFYLCFILIFVKGNPKVEQGLKICRQIKDVIKQFGQDTFLLTPQIPILL